MSDPYNILGVGRNSTDAEIKSAYRKLAKQYHPDIGGDQQRFAEITNAYDQIKDQDSRQNFDNGPSNFQQSHSANSFNMNFGADFDDVFNSMFGEQFRQHRPHRTYREQQRANINVTVHITLQDVFNSAEKNINITMPNGMSKPVKIKIPPGAQLGDRVRYQGMAPDGNDLLVTFAIKPNTAFEIDGDNLIKRLNISLKEAMLGTDKIIETLDNRSIKLHIKSGTQSGTKLRIPESGLPRRNKNNGDLLIEIKVKIPSIVAEESFGKPFEQVLIEQLSNSK